MNLDGRSEDLLAKRCRSLVVGQSLQEAFDCLADLSKCLFDSLTLRLASLQLRAPSVATIVSAVGFGG